MAKKMLIDAAHPEETRVVVLHGKRIDEFDFESAARKQLRGNIYLAKVTRVEPSLQAAFVDYGGGRHGFLAFSEIHPDYYQIPFEDRQRLLEQEAEESRRLEAEGGDHDTDDSPDREDGERSGNGRGKRGRGGRRRRKDSSAAEFIAMAEDTAEDKDDDGAREKAENQDSDSQQAAFEDEGQTTLPIEQVATDVEEAGIEAGAIHHDKTAEAAAAAAKDGDTKEPEHDQNGGTADADADTQTASGAPDTDENGESAGDTAQSEPATADTKAEKKVETAAPALLSTPEPWSVSAAWDAQSQFPDTSDLPLTTADLMDMPNTGSDLQVERAEGEEGIGDLVLTPAGLEPDSGTEETPGSESRTEDGEGNTDESGEDAKARGRKERGEEDGDEQREAMRRRSRIRMRNYKIQEVIKRRQILLVQVVKEERGNKGAALTTYLSLAGRYCVLMPNTPRGGGISRKITNANDRKRLKEIASDIDVPEGMGLIVRTAGAQRTKAEVRRDYDYLLRLWENVRELTLKSSAPALIYEEGSLIKRAIRDLYSREIDTVLVEGEESYKEAKAFMRMLMPSHAKNVQAYTDRAPLFQRYQVEPLLDTMINPVVQLPSGGYIVINPTEALVAIDVNSGKSTREHNIEDTALRTNLEAAEEIARQLRLRDLAGLIVIDFIDMEENRNNRSVERKLKECLKQDRARIQTGHISMFGLLEMSRQRLRTGMMEGIATPCEHCQGTGNVRSVESSALRILRACEEEGLRERSASITVHAPEKIVIYLLNYKRPMLAEIERRYGMTVIMNIAETMRQGDYEFERGETLSEQRRQELKEQTISLETAFKQKADEEEEAAADAKAAAAAEAEALAEEEDEAPKERPRRGRGRRSRSERDQDAGEADADAKTAAENGDAASDDEEDGEKRSASERDGDGQKRRRRRGKRGGRRHRRNGADNAENKDADAGSEAKDSADGDPAQAQEQAQDGERSDGGDAKQDSEPAQADTTPGSIGMLMDNPFALSDDPADIAVNHPAPEAAPEPAKAAQAETPASANGGSHDHAGETEEAARAEKPSKEKAEVAEASPPAKPRQGWWQRRLG